MTVKLGTRPHFAMVLAITMLSGSLSAQVAPLTILGLTLDQPIPFGECSPAPNAEKWVKNPRKFGGTFPYAAPSTTPCYERPNRPMQATPLGDENLIVRYPSAIRLAVSRNLYFGVRTISGKVSGVYLLTKGIETQDTDYQALKAKFGEPSDYRPQTWQNNFGARYTAVNAVWTFPNGAMGVYVARFDKTDQMGQFTLTTAEQERRDAAPRGSTRPTLGL